MTWPFENDTSAIVKKLAKRNVSSNRIFCFFNVLTIALAISLIVGISLFQQGSKISEQKILNQMQQATIGGLTAESRYRSFPRSNTAIWLCAFLPAKYGLLQEAALA